MTSRRLHALAALALLAVPRAGLAQAGTRSEALGGGPATAEGIGIRRYVFAGVAVDSFRAGAPWETLANAVNDLQGVREVLRGEYEFESPDDWILTNSAATERGVAELLDRLADAATGVREGDALVFFYAGHGTEHNERGFLVPHDVSKPVAQAQSQYVGVGQLVERLSDLPATHVLLILDSCKSGLALTSSEGLKAELSEAEMSQVIDDMVRNRSRLVVTSAGANQPAADGGGPLTGHSLFTGYLIEGLQRAVEGTAPADSLPTERGRLVTRELFDYVQDRVVAREARQTPTFGAFRGSDDGLRGQLVLAFDIDPFDDAYAEAIRISESDQARPREFRDAQARALELEDEESEGPRAWYLRYLEATLEGEEDLAEEVTALRRLKSYTEAGAVIPDEFGGRAVLNRLLANAEKNCRAAPACVAATSTSAAR
jgi:uncharacterized caspase-like protein